MIQVSKRIAVVLSVLIIAAVIIFFTFFNRKKTGIDYQDLIKAKDETIRVLQEQRPIFERQIEEMKVVIADHKRKDSLLIIQINSTKQSIRNVDERLKNIPARIDALGNDKNAIRRAITDL